MDLWHPTVNGVPLPFVMRKHASRKIGNLTRGFLKVTTQVAKRITWIYVIGIRFHQASHSVINSF